MKFHHDPDGLRLPIKLDSTSNGEYLPLPLERVHQHANFLAEESVTSSAKQLGLNRRGFLVSASGAAATLLSMNAAYAAAGKTGGSFEIDKTANLDRVAARTALDGQEFIFDVQGHFVNPTGAWIKHLPPAARPLRMPKTASCGANNAPANLDYLRCIGRDEFIKDVFLDSDTDLMVLSFVPSTRLNEPLTIEEAAATAQIVERLEGSHRLYIHGRVNPNSPGDIEAMDALAANHKIAAWKTYTQWGPDGKGFFMDDEVGIKFIEKAIKLGVSNIAIHKGLPFGAQSYQHSTCVDIGRVAKRYPKVNFLIYHAGLVAEKAEGAYDESRTDGIDALVTSLVNNGVAPGSNVYAELGSTWRILMRDPDSAAHALGKLFKYCGPNNVLWGTDSIWYGSPQDQIQAFRTFQISAAFRDKFGYPLITKELRAKVFGLNALKIYPVPADLLSKHLKADKVARQREAYREQPDPTFVTHGPKTRREFLNLQKWTA
jgi:uncharacterized protein